MIVWLTILTLSAGASPSWESALATQEASLTAEKAALQSSIASSEKESAAAARTIEGDIENLTKRLVELRAQNLAAQESFAEKERARGVKQTVEQLDSLMDGFRRWAHNQGLLGDGPKGTSRFAAFIEANGTLNDLTRVRMEKHDVFDQQGVASQRKVLRLGRVGAMKIADNRATPLEPVEGVRDTFQTVDVPAQVHKMAGGESTSVVLYDPRKPHEHDFAEKRDVLGWLSAGGFAMYPLFLMGIIALLVFIERFFVLAWVQRLWAKTYTGRARADASNLRKEDLTSWPLHPLKLMRDAQQATTVLEERVTASILGFRGRLSVRLAILAVISAAAPLLGLLGTVTGMIGTFRVITEHGTGDAELLSDGIAQALLTTQLGLAVAIPALLGHAALSRWTRRLVARAEMAALELWPAGSIGEARQKDEE